MIDAPSAILRVRRDLAIGSAVKTLLLIVGIAGLALAAPLQQLFGIDPRLILPAVLVVAMILGLVSLRGSRSVAISPGLIASGDFDQAELQIAQAMRSFSIFRAGKLLSLHYLAVLRHAERRWAESAMLCRALLSERLGGLTPVGRSSRLLLADSMLELNDLPAAYEALGGLYDQHLTLGEALNLTLVQLDYLSRVGAWEQMMQGVTKKVELCELMPNRNGARCQALLSLAAKRIGREDWANWLRHRVELLVDMQQLAAERPVLKELWEV